MKINIEVCEICKSEKCDGKIYETEDMYGGYGFHIGKKKICSSDPHLINNDNGIEYKLVIGHGMYEYYKVKEI